VYWCYFSGGEDKKNDLGVGNQLQYESDTADVLSLFKVAQNSNRKQNHIEDSSSNCKYNNPRNKNISWVPNFEQQISHHFPMFFSQKKVDDFSQKKNGGETPAATPAVRLRAEATSPRSHFCLAAWERPNSPWRPFMAHLWNPLG